MTKEEVREKLKKKSIVYLTDGTGPNQLWAVTIDEMYPWAGNFTSRKGDAAAFTVDLARLINKRLRESGMKAPYRIQKAPKSHEGPIYYLEKETPKG